MAGYKPGSGLLDPPTILVKTEYMRFRGANGQKFKRALPPCGTEAGYRRHIAAREEKDDACKAAHAQYRAKQRGGGYTGKRRAEPLPCGTSAAAARHRYNGEPVCFKCRVGESEARNRRRKPRPKTPKTPPQDTGACGTDKGYQRHGRAHQHACQPCKTAHADRKKEYQ